MPTISGSVDKGQHDPFDGIIWHLPVALMQHPTPNPSVILWCRSSNCGQKSKGTLVRQEIAGKLYLASFPIHLILPVISSVEEGQLSDPRHCETFKQVIERCQEQQARILLARD